MNAEERKLALLGFWYAEKRTWRAVMDDGEKAFVMEDTEGKQFLKRMSKMSGDDMIKVWVRQKVYNFSK